MFEKIVVRRSQNGPAFTLGEVAEALLFYKRVHLVLDVWSLKVLIDRLGPQGVLSLLRRDGVSAFYAEDMFLTQTDMVGSWPWHKFHSIALAGNENEKPRKDARGRLQVVLTNYGLTTREAWTFTDRFMERVKIRRFSSDYFVKGGLVRAAHTDALDTQYAREAMRRILANTIGFESFANDLKFDVVAADRPIGDFPDVPSFSLWTNIDFAAGNARRRKLAPTLEPVSEATLLGAIMEARADAGVASFYGGDFYTSAVNSEILQIKYGELLKRSGISVEGLQQFHNVVLDGYPTVREVIDSGAEPFDEFLKLLDRSAGKFRRWIHNASPDASLVREYFAEVATESWISRLPGKTVRYVLGQALSIAGLAMTPIAGVLAGAVFSAADTFLLERILNGWRPSHFVEGSLKPFLRSN